MVRGAAIADTINNCDDLKEFQLVTKISNKYTHIQHGTKRLKEKCVRVFASKNEADGGLTKIHAVKGNANKISNSPRHCFIVNDNINGVKCPSKLDKQFYIDLAVKRLKDKWGILDCEKI